MRTAIKVIIILYIFSRIARLAAFYTNDMENEFFCFAGLLFLAGLFWLSMRMEKRFIKH